MCQPSRGSLLLACWAMLAACALNAGCITVHVPCPNGGYSGPSGETYDEGVVRASYVHGKCASGHCGMRGGCAGGCAGGGCVGGDSAEGGPAGRGCAARPRG